MSRQREQRSVVDLGVEWQLRGGEWCECAQSTASMGGCDCRWRLLIEDDVDTPNQLRAAAPMVVRPPDCCCHIAAHRKRRTPVQTEERVQLIMFTV